MVTFITFLNNIFEVNRRFKTKCAPFLKPSIFLYHYDRFPGIFVESLSRRGVRAFSLVSLFNVRLMT